MTYLAQSRYFSHLLALVVTLAAAVAVLIVAQFGLAVLGLAGLVLTVVVFTILLAFTAGN